MEGNDHYLISNHFWKGSAWVVTGLHLGLPACTSPACTPEHACQGLPATCPTCHPLPATTTTWTGNRQTFLLLFHQWSLLQEHHAIPFNSGDNLGGTHPRQTDTHTPRWAVLFCTAFLGEASTMYILYSCTPGSSTIHSVYSGVFPDVW